MPRLSLEGIGDLDVPESLVPYVNVVPDDDNCFEWGIFVKPEIKEAVRAVGAYLVSTLDEGEALDKALDGLATGMLQAMLPTLGEFQARMEVVMAEHAADLKTRFPQAFEGQCDGGQ